MMENDIVEYAKKLRKHNEIAQCNGDSVKFKNPSRPKIHIEIQQQELSQLNRDQILAAASDFLNNKKTFIIDSIFTTKELPMALSAHIQQISIADMDVKTDEKKIENDDSVDIVYHVFKLNTEGPAIEEMKNTDGGDIPAATHWLLPSSDFKNLWQVLVYDTDVKEQLLKFVSTTMMFSDHGVDNEIISWNRVILLHGPPGTGKTSLCKALAQKLSIRLSHRYQYSQLFEVNSHSLFSKWFSESGKLVQNMFSQMMELAEDPDALVFILIDEVESLTRTRAATSSGDPSDALRVVNAVLTQLDAIKRFPNVLILTTSNVTGSIDLAFVDRADIKEYIGLPSQSAIYQIYYSCINELIRTSIIKSNHEHSILTLRQLKITNMSSNQMTKHSIELWDIAKSSEGLSGRALRKIPFRAHALHCKNTFPTLSEYMTALREAVIKHKSDDEKLLPK